MQSTYITWHKVCKFHGIRPDTWKLNGQYNYIEFNNGSRIDLLDLKYLPSDPLYERFGSLEFTDGAIEEAGEVHPLAYEVLKTRIGRHLNNEYEIKPNILITGNPKKNWTYTQFYKKYAAGLLDEESAFIQSLYTDNPFTATEYGKQLEDIADPVIKERLKFGNWEYDDSPNALIQYTALEDMFTNEQVQGGEVAITADIALQGSDRLVIMVWFGFRVVEIIAKDKSEAQEIENIIRELKTRHNVRNSRIVFDSDGVGAYLGSYLKGSVGFHANGKTKGSDKAAYKTFKDQCGYRLAKRVNEGGIYVESAKYKDLIISELEYLQTYKTDDDKELKVLPKVEIKKHLGRSPDFMDNFIMREALELREVTKVRFDF